MKIIPMRDLKNTVEVERSCAEENGPVYVTKNGYGRLVAFVEYKLSRRTKVYAELDNTRWRNGFQGTTNKATATGISAGVVHTF